MVSEGDCVAIFHSIHRVMKAEKALQEQQVDILLIPVPRQLSADCGMAICFPQAMRLPVEDILGRAGIGIRELWLMENEKYRQLT